MPLLLVQFLVAAIVVAGCGPSGPTTARETAGGANTSTERAPGQRKVLNLAITTILDAFSIAGSSTTSGGGLDYIEIHSQALFTADKTTGRSIPRLLAEQPTLDNAGLRVTDDGRMVATYKLRNDVVWADGAPFTARDLLFTYRVVQNRSMPVIDRGPALLMESAVAPDDHTFLITWKEPYYMADAIGLRPFWPLPAHLLETDFASFVEERQDSQGFLARPYWTSEYVHIGPYKLTNFSHGVEAVFDAVDHYFLGRPKVDRIVVKQFADQNTAFANILSGVVDLSPGGGLAVEGAVELKPKWDTDGGGKIYFGTGPTGFVSVQFDSSVPNYQPAMQDKRVRQALFHAVDREAYAEVSQGGIPDRAAYSLLPPDNPLYSYVRDGWKQRYAYDPARSVALLEQAGWRRGGDGLVANATGERLRIEIWDTPGGEDTSAVMADTWKQVGVDSQIAMVPAARVRNAEFRQQFPAVEITARGSQDSILTRLECAEQPSAQNRFSGNNRGHWCTPEYERLVTQYRTNLREEGRGQVIKQIQDLLLEELPIMLLQTRVSIVFARKGVTAFQDDFAGGSEAGRLYGTYSRNAHEWDVQ